MVRVNLIEPRGNWFLFEKWRGIYTIFCRQSGQMFQTCVQITVWSIPSSSKSFYTAKKVQRVIYYHEN